MARLTARGAWARRAALYDWLEGSDLRRASPKKRLFGRAHGRTLLVGAGTGLDLPHLAAGSDVTAIDISDAMLTRARARAAASPARVRLVAADALRLPFPDGVFETVITSCTMCSVPDPLRAFTEIRRVLARSGRLLMFEHVRSTQPVLAATLEVMTWWTRRGGTEMNRDTVSLASKAGFRIARIESVFLDIILAVEALPPNDTFAAADRKEYGGTGSARRADDPCGAPRTRPNAM